MCKKWFWIIVSHTLVINVNDVVLIANIQYSEWKLSCMYIHNIIDTLDQFIMIDKCNDRWMTLRHAARKRSNEYSEWKPERIFSFASEWILCRESWSQCPSDDVSVYETSIRHVNQFSNWNAIMSDFYHYLLTTFGRRVDTILF